MLISLSIKERFVFSSILPKQGSFIDQAMRDDLLSRAKVTSREMQEVDMVTDESTGVTNWNVKKEKDFSLCLTEKEMEFILKGINELDRQKNIQFDYNGPLCIRLAKELKENEEKVECAE